jgi:hypothetical protein
MRGDWFDHLTRRGAFGALLGLTAAAFGRPVAAAGCAGDGGCPSCAVCLNGACAPLDPICGPMAPRGSPGCDPGNRCDECGHCVPIGGDVCEVDADCGGCRVCLNGTCVTRDPMCLPNAPIGTPPCGRRQRCDACGVCTPVARRRRKRRRHGRTRRS